MSPLNSDSEGLSTSDSSLSDYNEDDSSIVLPTRAERRENQKIKKERLLRTIFVGNLPSSMTKKRLHKIFRDALKNEGISAVVCKVESVRLRGAIPRSGSTSKQARKRSSIQHDFAAGGSQTQIGFVVLTSRAGIPAALKMNGSLLSTEHSSGGTHHLRVDVCGRAQASYIPQKSVFVGNLPFSTNEEEVRRAFVPFGKINSVRLVRDSYSGMVKGIGFVEFNDASSVSLAIRQGATTSVKNSGGVIVGDRQLRVEPWKSIKKAKRVVKPQEKRKVLASASANVGNCTIVKVPTNIRHAASRQSFVRRTFQKRKKKNTTLKSQTSTVKKTL